MANRIFPTQGTTFGIPNELLLRGPLGGLGGGVLGNPLLDIGASIAALGGPAGARAAESLQFAAQRGQGALRNLALLQGIQQQQRRNQAVGRLQGLLGSVTEQDVLSPALSRSGLLAAVEEGLDPTVTQQVPTIQTPQGRQQALQVLAQLAPEQVASTLLAQPRPPDTDIVRRSDGSVALINSQTGDVVRELGGPGASLDEIQSQLSALQAQQRQFELQREQREQRVQVQTARDTVRSRLDNLERVIDLNRRLQETGQADQIINALGDTSTNFARIAKEVFGGNPQAQRLAQEFRQRVNRLILDESAQRNLRTNFGLRLTQDIKPSLATDPGVNARIFADMLEESLRAANVVGLDLGARRSELQKLEQEQRRFQPADPLERIPGFGDLTPQEQQELRDRFQRLTPEERRRLLNG